MFARLDELIASDAPFGDLTTSLVGVRRARIHRLGLSDSVLFFENHIVAKSLQIR